MESTENGEYFEEDEKLAIDDKTHFVKYLCKFCDKYFKSKHLKTHIKSVHEQIKYPCNLCEYKATVRGSLKRHVESVHEKVKYPCNLCE